MDGRTVDARGMLCPKPLILVKKALAGMAVGERLTVLLDNETACDNVRRFLQDHGGNPVGETADGVYTLRAVKAQGVAGAVADERCELPGGVAAAEGSGHAGRTGRAGGRPGQAGQDPAGVGPVSGATGVPAGGMPAGGQGMAVEVPVSRDRRPGGGPMAEAGPRRPAVVVLNREWMGTGSEDLGRLLLQGCLNTLKELDPLPAAVVLYNAGVRLACEGSPVLGPLKELEAAGVRLLVCGTCLDFFELKPKRQVGMVSNMYEILQTLAAAGPVINP
ncbi:MAG: sulfurtransferase-like selenium metabolism protein YedF [Candidatus Riflebacteria bacterium]|nr:sulfurtransferase-like selenium metabolism protein YedF [Candidatus Riflebacteria bacterium]